MLESRNIFLNHVLQPIFCPSLIVGYVKRKKLSISYAILATELLLLLQKLMKTAVSYSYS